MTSNGAAVAHTSVFPPNNDTPKSIPDLLNAPRSLNPYDFQEDELNSSSPTPNNLPEHVIASSPPVSPSQEYSSYEKREHAFKMASSSKRRKQSNPVRISAEQEAAAALMREESAAANASRGEEAPLDLTAAAKMEPPEEGELPGAEALEKQHFMAQLHAAAQHQSGIPAGINPFLVGPVKPEPGMLPFGSHPFLFPFFPRPPGEPGGGQGSPGLINTSPSSMQTPLRIFNPEAYCELCNKEFCNKYFLKTHKANKHGIYQPDESPIPATTTASSGPSTPTTTSTSATTLAKPPSPAPIAATSTTTPSVSAVSLTLSGPMPTVSLPTVPAPVARVPLVSYPGGGMTPVSASAFMASMAAAPIPSLVPSSVQSTSSIVLGPHQMSQLLSTRPAGFGDVKCTIPGVINIEAYCHVCQKEFCNKYFLKRHKFKIHGIVTPEPEDAKTRKVRAKPTKKTPSSTTPGNGEAGAPPKKRAAFESTSTCPVCKQDFPSALELDNHIIMVHKVNRAPQPVLPPPPALNPIESLDMSDKRIKEEMMAGEDIKSDSSSPKPISIFQVQVSYFLSIFSDHIPNIQVPYWAE